MSAARGVVLPGGALLISGEITVVQTGLMPLLAPLHLLSSAGRLRGGRWNTTRPRRRD